MSTVKHERQVTQIRETAGQPFTVTIACVVCGFNPEGKGGLSNHLEHSPECREELLKRLEAQA